MTRAIALALLLCTFSHPIFAYEKNIYWRIIDWPPFYILEGPSRGMGVYDQMIQLIERHMPEWQHHRRPMSTARVHKEWKNGRNICHPSVLPGPHGYESKVNSLLLPHRIISAAKPIQEQHADTRPISLDALLGDSRFIGGITPDRYSPEINQIVAKHQHARHLVTSPRYHNLVTMVLKGRVDYLIEYPPIIRFRANQEKLSGEIKSYAIKELKQDYLKVVFACTDNRWGRDIIHRINQILIDEAQRENFVDFRLRWYDPDSQSVLGKLYQSVYLQDKQPIQP